MALPMDEARAYVAGLSDYVQQVRDAAAALQTPGRTDPRRPSPRRPPVRGRDVDGERIRRANNALIIAFVDSMQWRIVVPGQDELLDHLRAMEKDVVADGRSIRNRVRIGLLNEFENYDQVVTAGQVRRTAAALIIETILLRLDGRLFDVRLRANTDRWTRFKHSLGLPTWIGQFRGVLRNAIATLAEIEWL